MITSWAVWVGDKQLCVRVSREVAVAIAWGIHQDSGKPTCVEEFHGPDPARIVWKSGG